MSLLTLSRRALALGFALALGVGVAGCDHMTDPAGPNLVDRFGPFSILEPLGATQTEVDFAAGETVVFTARFNKQVAWTVEITGQESGAVKRIEGFSNELDGDNARWNGSTTDLPLFKDEPVTAVLIVDESGAEQTTTSLEVTGPRAYPGIVLADFEGGDAIALTNPEFEFDDVGIRSEMPPPAQGDGFFLLRGTDDVVANNFFIGLITITPPGGGTFDVPTTVASDLFFNCFLYGFGTANTIAVVEVVIDTNGNGTLDGSDRIVPLGGDVEFPNLGVVDFEGWRPYSESADSFGQFGNGISDAETERIVGVRVVLISDANAQPTPPLQVEFGIDYLTFTAGGPLEL